MIFKCKEEIWDSGMLRYIFQTYKVRSKVQALADADNMTEDEVKWYADPPVIDHADWEILEDEPRIDITRQVLTKACEVFRETHISGVARFWLQNYRERQLKEFDARIKWRQAGNGAFGNLVGSSRLTDEFGFIRMELKTDFDYYLICNEYVNTLQCNISRSEKAFRTKYQLIYRYKRLPANLNIDSWKDKPSLSKDTKTKEHIMDMRCMTCGEPFGECKPECKGIGGVFPDLLNQQIPRKIKNSTRNLKVK
jgi:hypothetical protein